MKWTVLSDIYIVSVDYFRLKTLHFLHCIRFISHIFFFFLRTLYLPYFLAFLSWTRSLSHHHRHPARHVRGHHILLWIMYPSTVGVWTGDDSERCGWWMISWSYMIVVLTSMVTPASAPAQRVESISAAQLGACRRARMNQRIPLRPLLLGRELPAAAWIKRGSALCSGKRPFSASLCRFCLVSPAVWKVLLSHQLVTMGNGGRYRVAKPSGERPKYMSS